MCGITGFVHFERGRAADVTVLQRMTDTVRHRGPDGAGYHVNGNVALGHRRLKIIDLVTGDQPMIGADEAAVIVFNGEIYNYIELREELQRRSYPFRTNSDTEVILAAYREWGEACVSRFNGMWAFALWDVRDQKLFCSRDRLGEKPFYYAVVDHTFVFGSEPKALFAYGVPRDPNPAVLDAYLCLTYVPGPETFFRGLQRLAPGYNLTVQDGVVRVASYWNVTYATEREARRDERQIVAEFRDLLRDAVRIRMRSDVPYGAFLSGGLDSATVVALMAGLSPAPVKTCTIGFQDPEFDETAAAALVAARYSTDHWVRTATIDDVGDTAPRLGWHFDEPFGDSSAVPTYLVARAGRERVTMVLTGDGGDEVLSGYPIHQGEKLSAYYRRLPRVVGAGAIPWLVGGAARIGGGVGAAGQLLNRAHRVAAAAHLPFAQRLETKMMGLRPANRRRLLRDWKAVTPVQDIIEQAVAPVRDCDDMTKLNYFLLKVELPDQMLTKVDRMTMAHGLEARLPFLDHRIVEFLAGVSMDVKLKGLERKHVLRRAAGDLLPPENLRKGKRGFGMPLRYGVAERRKALELLEHFDDQWGALVDRAVLEGVLRSTDGRRGETRDGAWALGMLLHAMTSSLRRVP